MRRHWSRCRRSGARGRCRQSMEPRNRGSSWVPTRSEHAEGDSGYAGMARRRRTWRGRSPLACTETCCAEPGRPCSWPGIVWPGPHGEPTGYDRAGRVQGVGPLHSTEEACAPRSPSGPAEQVEGRERAKGNVAEEPRSRTQCRGLLSQALSRVRQAPLGACTSDPRQEPGAGKPHAGICAGGVG
jgi:hypothetical protein